MTTAFRAIISLCAILVVAALAGCASAIPTTTSVYPSAPTFPPTTPDQVAVLSADPGRPYVRLGQVTAAMNGTDVSKGAMKEALQLAASKLGADAVVVIHDENNVVGAIVTGPWYDQSLEHLHDRSIVGVAIRYTSAGTPAN